MNKIVFPLKSDMKSSAVANLHAGLTALEFKIDDSELDEQYYGETTTEVIYNFQAAQNLPETGQVNDLTAHTLNRALQDAKHIENYDSYVLQGRITNNKTGDPVAGLLIRAVDSDPSGENPIGQPVFTDSDGHYLMVYYDHQFRIAGHESGNADVIVRVFNPDDTAKELAKSKRRSNVKRETTVNLKVDFEHPVPEKPTEDNPSPVVQGFVRHADGKPVTNATVKAFDVRLRYEHPLADSTTDDDGHYEVSYPRKQGLNLSTSITNLRVRAYDDNGGEVAQSTIIYNAGDLEELNLTVHNTVYRGPSEYTQLVTLLEPYLHGIEFAELQEDELYTDVTDLSGSTEADPQLIAYLIVAHRLAKRTPVAPELYYALFRNGLPVELPALLIQDPVSLTHTLESAITNNLIPDQFKDEIETLPETFMALLVEEALQPLDEGGSQAPLVDLIATVLPNDDDRKAFVKQYVTHSGTNDEFWKTVSATPQFTEKVGELQFTLDATALTGSHPPLIKALQASYTHPDPNKKIDSVDDLARYDEFDWLGILERDNDGSVIGTPATIPGADEAERKLNYARFLARRIELNNPTAYIAERLSDDDLDGQPHLVKFFQNNRTSFDMMGTRLKAYVDSNPSALDGIPDSEKPKTIEQLRTMQRLYHIAPSYTAMSNLYKADVKSAHDVVSIGSTTFKRKFASKLGTNTTSKTLQGIYARAEGIHTMTTAVVASLGLEGKRETIASISNEQSQSPVSNDTPDWTRLFGLLDMCDCDHCRSVYSPAAYLVDILHFLNKRTLYDLSEGAIKRNAFNEIIEAPETGKFVSDVLFKRRADIADIELTCENTNTPLPYVDLVNEILEDYVAPPPDFVPMSFTPIAPLVNDLNQHKIPPQLASTFTENATVEVKIEGELWAVHTSEFTYSIRKLESDGLLRILTRSRQTIGTLGELTANPQYLNPEAYGTLAQQVFPLTLPFDLWQRQTQVYLEHLGTQRDHMMRTFLPGTQLARLNDTNTAIAYLNLTTVDVTIFDGSSSVNDWEQWGFSKASLDDSSAISDPLDSSKWITTDVQNQSNTWWHVLTGRVDVFLQQSGLTYIQLLELLGTYFVNPDPNGPENRPITIQSHDTAFVDTCETSKLWIKGMNVERVMKSLRFIRLWRKLGWTMRDVDRALTILLPKDSVAINEQTLTQLSLIQRLSTLLQLPIEKLLPFWGQISFDLYTDHETSGQPPYLTLYEQLFRNKNVLNPPDQAFTKNPDELAGVLVGHETALSAGLGISATDLDLLINDQNSAVLPGAQPALTIANLSILYRHTTLAKSLRLKIRDYLIALKLYGDPFIDQVVTLHFVESIYVLRRSSFTLEELDYLSHHIVTESNRVAPTDEDIARFLTDLRAEIQRITTENEFVAEPSATEDATVDMDGELTREKLALLGWDTILIDDIINTLNGTMTYRTSLAALPIDETSFTDKPISFSALAGELSYTGIMSLSDLNALKNLSLDPTYRTALTNLYDAPRELIKRNMRRFVTEHYEVNLDTMPQIDIPATIGDRLYYDADAKKLYFVGAMTATQRDDLRQLVNNGDPFDEAIKALFNAPDAKAKDDVFLRHDDPTDANPVDDIAYLLDVDNRTPQERYHHILHILLDYLQSHLRQQAIIQMLADTLGLEIQTMSDLLMGGFGQNGPKLIDAFITELATSNSNIPVSRTAFPNSFDTYTHLHKVALIIERLEATPEQVNWLYQYATTFNWIDLQTLPITPQPVASPSLDSWLRLIEAFGLSRQLPRGDKLLDDLFRHVWETIQLNNPDNTTLNGAKQAYIDVLVDWMAWSTDDLKILLGDTSIDNPIDSGLLTQAFPADYAGAHLLKRLVDCFSFLQQLGMSATQVKSIVAPDVADNPQTTSNMVKHAARAKYTEEQWLEIARPLRDALREEQRQALVAYLLAHPDAEHPWRDVNDIYAYFLIDVEMDPCMMTSRIKQAISSVQLFVQRCLMNLESQVLASAELDDRWREWDWMKNYRIWEANRKIFLYPENWVVPQFRDNKSPFFGDLESELLQNDLTYDSAETAFRSYLEKLDEVARLEIIGMVRQPKNNTNPAILHVVGRTYGIPHIYYYRQQVDAKYWTAWERIDLDIEGDHLIPVVWRGRLHLIWPTFIQLPQSEAQTSKTKQNLEIHLARSEYRNGKWSPKRVSERSVVKYVNKRALIFKGFATSNTLDVMMIEHLYVEQEEQSDVMEGFAYAPIPGSGGNGGISPVNNNFPNFELEDRVESEVMQPAEYPRFQYRFRLFDCNGDFGIRKEDYQYSFTYWSLHSHYNWLRESKKSQNSLFLPDTETSFDVALEKTPNSRFRLLYPHQDKGFTGIRKGPLFYNDNKHTYFVMVYPPPIPGLWDNMTDGNELTHRFSFAPAPEDDPFNPLIDEARLLPAVIAGDPLLFPEPASEMSVVDSPDNLVTTSTALTMNNPTLALARDTLVSANIRYVAKLRYINKYHYVFHTFYHPYVCSLITAMNRNGIEALLQRPKQLKTDEGETFKNRYEPHVPEAQLVSKPYPTEIMDFDSSGSYSLYNWELFFHIPLLIATSLSQNQRFADAQKWFHYIFDPTDTSGLPSPERYWRTKPFHIKTTLDYQVEHVSNLMRLLASRGDADQLPINDPELKSALLASYNDLLASIEQWRAKPFNPHLIARTRTTAYQKTVVMKYIDNLIQWGDQLFRRDTIESINEATQLYIMAGDLLGKRPEKIPPRAVPQVHTYKSLQPKLGEFSNALAEIEEFVAPSATEISVDSTSPVQTPMTMLYFCVPKNDELLSYWDTVDDRLFKIRHCMNIEGVVRQLPLFSPPINPALLVRATAAGIDLSSVLNDINAPLPHYRFNIIAQKATELCNELKSLGSTLLSTLEKRDAEKLSLLRAEHETALLKLIEQVREQQLEEADQQLVALRASRELAATRYSHYQRLLGAQDTQAPDEGAVITDTEASQNASTIDKDGVRLIEYEKTELNEMEDARNNQHWASGFDIAASVAHIVPNYTTSFFFGEATWGGSNVGSALSAFGTFARAMANEDTYDASRASRMGQHVMRELDWVLQSNLAAKEIMNIDQQIISAEIRQAIADHELSNHRRQIENAEKVEETMRHKYTNQELYSWMIGQISTVYFQSYQLAYDVAKRAERAFRYDLGIQDSNYIQFGYWDSLKKGLLAGERLHHDLKRMEIAYLNQNRREYEITKHISLRQLNPTALIQLRQTGKCEIDLPEFIFDLDYPGHYMRRVKNVSITIPAVTGPYTGIPCTLRQLRSSVRRSADIRTEYLRDITEDDPRFSDSIGLIQSVVTSSGQNDSGLFEPNLNDERILPFERTGAISTWEIELPSPDGYAPFDYFTIADVVLHMRYTARDGGAEFKQSAHKAIIDATQRWVEVADAQGLIQFVSMKHEFGTAFHKFLNPDTEGNYLTTITLTPQHFPFLFQQKGVQIEEVTAVLKLKDGFDFDRDALNLSINDVIGDRDEIIELASSPHITYTHLNSEISDIEDWEFNLSGIDLTDEESDSETHHKSKPLQDIVLLIRYTIAEL